MSKSDRSTLTTEALALLVDAPGCSSIRRAFPDGKVRNRHSRTERDVVSRMTGVHNTEPSLTQQHMAADCDINNIIASFNRTGQLTSENRAVPQFGDFTEVSDFHDNLNRVNAAQAMFMDLPADLRARFNNDPGNYVDFVLDPSNVDEVVKLGLAVMRPDARSGDGSRVDDPNVSKRESAPSPTSKVSKKALSDRLKGIQDHIESLSDD